MNATGQHIPLKGETVRVKLSDAPEFSARVLDVDYAQAFAYVEDDRGHRTVIRFSKITGK